MGRGRNNGTVYKWGYDKPNILKAEIDAMEKVKNGEAAWEQDGVVFYEKSPHFEILASLLYALSLGGISVLDHGGALGSMFFRHLALIEAMDVKWNIVEQKHFVDYGKTNIPEISFYYTKEECLRNKNINFVLFSSVLGYLPDGLQTIEDYLKLNMEYVCVDSTAFFVDDSEEKIMLQHVPRSIYRAEYPIHIFNWRRLCEVVGKYHYTFIFEWNREGIPIYKKGFQKTDYRGFLIKRNKESS